MLLIRSFYQDKMIIVTKIVSLLLDYQDKMIQLVERLFSHRCDVPVRKVGESDKNKKKVGESDKNQGI